MSPNGYQTIEFPPKLRVLFRPSRYKILYGGRGAAKSWGIARALLVKAAEKPLRILCAREVQKSIQDSVYRLLLDQIQVMGLGPFFRATESEIIGRNGSEFFFAGIRGQTIQNLKSYEGVDICWVEEAQVVTKRSWDVLTPTIRKEGSEIWITFNPDLDSDETYTRFVVRPPQGAVTQFLSYEDNPWFPQVLENERLDCCTRDPSGYRNIWLGECRTAVEGAIYASEVGSLIASGRYRPVPYDPMLLVHTVWDLGWNDKMAIILAQRLGGELRIIDYLEDSHLTLADYVSGLEANKMRWGTDWLPHDGAAKDIKTGKSAQEVLQALGRKVQIVPKLDVEQGIKLVRLMFPRLYIDIDKAGRLVDCLKRYRRAIPTTTQEPAAPLHDEYSHGCFIGRTKVRTRYGMRQIMDLPETGEIMTLCGFKPYHSARITRKNAQLVEVRFTGGYMVRCTPDHLFLTDNGWKSASSLTPGLLIRSGSIPSLNISKGASIVAGLNKIISREITAGFIAVYGKLLSGLSLLDVISIIATATPITTPLRISNASMLQSIYRSPRVNKGHIGPALALWKKLLNGIGQKKGERGIDGMPRKKSFGKNSSALIGLVCSAGRLFTRLSATVGGRRSFAAITAKPLIIESVMALEGVADVWCLTVPDIGSFCLENGAVVHNCDALRYCAIIADQMVNEMHRKPLVYPKRAYA